jgi:hypothetical protein
VETGANSNYFRRKGIDSNDIGILSAGTGVVFFFFGEMFYTFRKNIGVMKPTTVYDIQVYNKILALPKELKNEVLDFIDFLKQKKHAVTSITERQFGCAGNTIIMKEDFDEPLSDFNDYL